MAQRPALESETKEGFAVKLPKIAVAALLSAGIAVTVKAAYDGIDAEDRPAMTREKFKGGAVALGVAAAGIWFLALS